MPIFLNHCHFDGKVKIGLKKYAKSGDRLDR